MEKLKIPILSFIVTFSMLVQAQAQEIKAVLIDTLKFGNIKFGGTRQVQKDTAKEYSADMIKGALNDQYTVEDTIKPIQVEDITRDSLPEELRSLRDQLIAEMKLPGTKIDGKIDSGSFRRDGPYFPLMQRTVWTLAMEKDRNGLAINVPAGNPDSRAGSTKGEYKKGNVETIRQYIIDKGYTSYTQLPKAKTASRRGQANGFPIAYIFTGSRHDVAVANGQNPEIIQGQVNFTFLHELGHVFGLGHTEGVMQNATSYIGRKNYITEHNGEHLSPEVNEQLITFLLEQKVFGLDTLTSINNEIFNQKFQLYPNPAHDIIHIRTMEDIKISSVIITDVTGRKVKEINLTSADNTGHDHIEIKDIRSEITPGMYILSISTSQGIVNKKVIIQ